MKIKLSLTEKIVLIFAGLCATLHCAYMFFQLGHPDYLSWITIVDYLMRWVQLPWLLVLAIFEDQKDLSPTLTILFNIGTILINGIFAYIYFSRRIPTDEFVDFSIDKELRPGESLIWKGRPPQGILIHPHFLIILPVATAVSIVMSIVLNPIFAIFPFQVALLWLFVEPLTRKHQWYFITRERVLIYSGNWPHLSGVSIELKDACAKIYNRSWGGWIFFIVSLKESPVREQFFGQRMAGMRWPYFFRPYGRFWIAFPENIKKFQELCPQVKKW